MNDQKADVKRIYMMCKVSCPVCDIEISRCNYPKHRKTKKHRTLVEKYHGGMITDMDKFNDDRALLNARKGF